jgi:hypothetical protein
MEKTRLEYNRKIIAKLSELIEQYPNFRFVQLLYACGIIDGSDRFYDESLVSYKKLDNINLKKDK